MKFTYTILAAGRGTRMGELTSARNKCMLLYKGKPILSYIIDTLIAVGAEEIVLTVNHCKNEIINFLTLKYPNISFKFIEENLEGTGKSVDNLRNLDADYILVMMADTILDTNIIINFINEFKRNPSNYILSKKVEDPRKYGVLEVEGDRVKNIIEKPENPPSNLINLGVYIFNKNIFKFTKNLEKSIRGEYEITDAIQASINAGNIFRHFIHKNQILDFTSPKDLQQE